MNTRMNQTTRTKGWGIFRIASAAAIGLVVAALAACGGGSGNDSGGSSASTGAGGEDSAAQEALQKAESVVQDALADYPEATQVVLSESAKTDTYAYGAVDAPFAASDAITDLTHTVTVSDGKFEISATSAATGKVYTIDQDGVITEGSE